MRLFSDKPETIGSALWASRLREAITAARSVMSTAIPEVEAASYRVSSFWVGFFADQYYKKHAIPGFEMRYHFKARAIYIHSYGRHRKTEHDAFRHSVAVASKGAPEGALSMVTVFGS